MIETVRETVIGHLIRWLSGGRLLPYAEDGDPSLWKMYISTEKSKTLEPMVIEEKRRKPDNGRKLQKKRNTTPAPAAGGEKEASQEKNADSAQQEESKAPATTAWSETGNPALPSGDNEKSHAETEATAFPEDTENGGEPVGGDIDTGGTWDADEIGHAWADNEKRQTSSDVNTPKTQSNIATPYNSSSTALLSVRTPDAPAAPEDGNLEQGWVTAALGQEGMDFSMEPGQVDGDPALQMHSEGDETAWNAVQLEAGEPEINQDTKIEADTPEERVCNVVVWFGPRDSANPLNWSHGKRAFVTAQIYLLTICTYIGTSIFSAGSNNVQEHFGVSEVKATLGTSLAVLGYGLGVMIWSPLSEAIRVGRKPVYLVTLTVFVALQVPTALAVNFGMLLAFRFLSGIFGAPVLAIGGASINDMYPPTQRGYAIMLWNVFSISAPVLGPVIGGFAASANGWRWTIWTLMWFSGGSLLFFIFFMPETNQSNILYRRCRRLRILTGNRTLRTEQGVLGGQLSVGKTLHRLFARPFVLCFTEPILLVINVYIALLNAVLFGSLDSFPFVFRGIYGFNQGEVGLSFLGLFIGSALSLPPMFYYLRYGVSSNASGEVKPEKRLPPAIVGAFLVPISLLTFAWTARTSVHWIVPIAASSLFGTAVSIISYASLNYLPDAYPSCAASVLAGNEFMRSSAAAVFPLFTTAMYNRLGAGGASSLLAGLSCLFIPVPIVLYSRGHIIRALSKRAKQNFADGAAEQQAAGI